MKRLLAILLVFALLPCPAIAETVEELTVDHFQANYEMAMEEVAADTINNPTDLKLVFSKTELESGATHLSFVGNVCEITCVTIPGSSIIDTIMIKTDLAAEEMPAYNIIAFVTGLFPDGGYFKNSDRAKDIISRLDAQANETIIPAARIELDRYAVGMRILSGDNIVLLLQNLDSELSSDELDEIFQSGKPATTRRNASVSSSTEEKFQAAFISYYRTSVLLSGMGADPDAAEKIFPFQLVGDESINQDIITKMAKSDNSSFSVTLSMDGADGSIKGAVALVFFLSSSETNNSLAMLLAFFCSLYHPEEGAVDLTKGLEIFTALVTDNEEPELEYSDGQYVYTFKNEKSYWFVSAIPVGDKEGVDSAPAPSTSGAVTLSVGTYDCPTHIPAGEYKVTPQKGGNLFVYRDDKLIVNEVLRPDDGDEIGRLILQEGDSIEIAGGAKFSFEPLK